VEDNGTMVGTFHSSWRIMSSQPLLRIANRFLAMIPTTTTMVGALEPQNPAAVAVQE
jgi:hypothetical protein